MAVAPPVERNGREESTEHYGVDELVEVRYGRKAVCAYRVGIESGI